MCITWVMRGVWSTMCSSASVVLEEFPCVYIVAGGSASACEDFGDGHLASFVMEKSEDSPSMVFYFCV